MNMITVGALLLLVGGILNSVPPVGTSLAGVFGGTPVIQIIVGVVSMIIGLVMFIKRTVMS